ncbi:MAG: hypothetical protein WC765_07190 [Phycisphaerae bacterium]|jgi:hypothetical protein
MIKRSHKFSAAFSCVIGTTIIEAGDELTAQEKMIDDEYVGEYLLYAEDEEPILWYATAHDINILSGHKTEL